jgi:hypothetical protein
MKPKRAPPPSMRMFLNASNTYELNVRTGPVPSCLESGSEAQPTSCQVGRARPFHTKKVSSVMSFHTHTHVYVAPSYKYVEL